MRFLAVSFSLRRLLSLRKLSRERAGAEARKLLKQREREQAAKAVKTERESAGGESC
jgi:hypothetical protein